MKTIFFLIRKTRKFNDDQFHWFIEWNSFIYCYYSCFIDYYLTHFSMRVCVCVWSCYFVDCWKLWWLLNHVFGDYCTVCVCVSVYTRILNTHINIHTYTKWFFVISFINLMCFAINQPTNNYKAAISKFLSLWNFFYSLSLLHNSILFDECMWWRFFYYFPDVKFLLCTQCLKHHNVCGFFSLKIYVPYI